MPSAPFLLPGVGAQGGRVAELGAAFAPGRAGGLISASRSIADAYRERGGEPRRRRGRPRRPCASRPGRFRKSLREAAQPASASLCGVAPGGDGYQRRQRRVATQTMIITVTLNAAIDKSLAVPNFRLGRRHRTVEQRTAAGGKGVNIARTLKALGQPVIATGFAGGATGTHIVEQLTEESILNDFVRIREESRTNTSVLDPTTGQQTEINERGPAVSEQRGRTVPATSSCTSRAAPRSSCSRARCRAAWSPTCTRRWSRELERLDVLTVVDTDGEPLRQAVRAEPDVVSPNVLEAEELVGHEFASEEESLQAVAEIAALGPREAIMTLPDGCFAQVLVDGQRVVKRARVEQREPIGKVGSGDAFLAGYLAARYEGRAPDQCLRFGVACGAESTARLGAGLIDAREARRLMGDVELTLVELPAEVG